jgi:hypothetical protein
MNYVTAYYPVVDSPEELKKIELFGIQKTRLAHTLYSNIEVAQDQHPDKALAEIELPNIVFEAGQRNAMTTTRDLANGGYISKVKHQFDYDASVPKECIVGFHAPLNKQIDSSYDAPSMDSEERRLLFAQNIDCLHLCKNASKSMEAYMLSLATEDCDPEALQHHYEGISGLEGWAQSRKQNRVAETKTVNPELNRKVTLAYVENLIREVEPMSVGFNKSFVNNMMRNLQSAQEELAKANQNRVNANRSMENARVAIENTGQALKDHYEMLGGYPDRQRGGLHPLEVAAQEEEAEARLEKEQVEDAQRKKERMEEIANHRNDPDNPTLWYHGEDNIREPGSINYI